MSDHAVGVIGEEAINPSKLLLLALLVIAAPPGSGIAAPYGQRDLLELRKAAGLDPERVNAHERTPSAVVTQAATVVRDAILGTGIFNGGLMVCGEKCPCPPNNCFLSGLVPVPELSGVHAMGVIPDAPSGNKDEKEAGEPEPQSEPESESNPDAAPEGESEGESDGDEAGDAEKVPEGVDKPASDSEKEAGAGSVSQPVRRGRKKSADA